MRGSSSGTYSECSQCSFGYNVSTSSCYPSSCPYGDCATPDLGNTLPDQFDTDSPDVVSAIRDLQSDLSSGVKVTNFSVLTNSLDTLSTDLKSKLGTESTKIVDSISSLKTNLSAITQAIEDKDLSGGSGTVPDTTETNDECVADSAGVLPSFVLLAILTLAAIIPRVVLTLN